jgi:hypothetical protein
LVARHPAKASKTARKPRKAAAGRREKLMLAGQDRRSAFRDYYTAILVCEGDQTMIMEGTVTVAAP